MTSARPAISGDFRPIQDRTVVDPPDDRYLPGYRQGLSGVGPRLATRDTAFSTYGLDIPISLGDRRLTGQVVWARKLEERSETKDGFTTFSYFGTFAVSFGYGADTTATGRRLVDVTADGRLILDNSVNGRGIARSFVYRWYDGSETQPQDPAIVADLGATNTPAYLGQMLLVIENLPLKSFDDKIPLIQARVDDYSAETAVSVEIVATGESGNYGQVFVDWDRSRAYVRNTSTTPDGMFVYDLENLTLLSKVAVNATGIPQDGGVIAGLGQNAWYLCPWNNTIIAYPDLLAFDMSPYIADAESGIVLQYAIDATKPPNTLVAARMGSSDNTIISVMAGFQEWSVLASTPSGMYLVHKLTVGYGGNRHAIGPTTVDTAIVFASNDTGGVDRMTINSGAFALNSSPIVDVDWLLYDGVIASPLVSLLLYVPEKDAMLVVYDTMEARLVELATGNNIWRITGLAAVPGSHAAIALANGDRSGGIVVWRGTGNNVIELNIHTGQVSTFNMGSNLISTGSPTFHGPSRSLVGIGLGDDRLRRVRYREVDGGRVTIATLVTQLAIRQGYQAVDIDVQSSADDMIDGILLEETTSLDEVVNALRFIYGYDIFESGTTLVVRDKKSSYTAPDIEIDIEDLIGNKEIDALQERQEPDMLLPRRVSITYIDKGLGFRWATQTWSRPASDVTAASQNTLDFKVPFIMSGAEAKLATVRAAYEPWVARNSQAFKLPRRFSTVIPGDIIRITVPGGDLVVRVVDTTHNPDFTISVDAQDFQPFTPFYIEAYSGQLYQRRIPTIVEDRFILLDIQPLSDQDAWLPGQNGFYYMLAPEAVTSVWDGTSGWFGQEIAGQINWQKLEDSDVPVPIGRLTKSLEVAPEGSTHALDTTSTINIQIIGGDASLLNSVTYDELQQGANIAAVGAPGRWEIIRYQTVSPELDGSITISDIMRGSHGSEWNARAWMKDIHVYGDAAGGGPPSGVWYPKVLTQHYWGNLSSPGDYFVPLKPEWLKRFVAPPAAVGVNFRFMASNNTSGKVGKVMTPAKHSWRSKPCGIDKVERDANGILTVKWKPSVRSSYPLQSGDNPLIPSEPSETNLYRVLVICPKKVEDAPTSSSHTAPQTDEQMLNRPLAFPRSDSKSVSSVQHHSLINSTAISLGFSWNGHPPDQSSKSAVWMFIYEGNQDAVQSFTLPHRVYCDYIPNPTERWVQKDGTLSGLTPGDWVLGHLEYDHVYVSVSRITNLDCGNNFSHDHRHLLLNENAENYTSYQLFDPAEASRNLIPSGHSMGHHVWSRVWVEDVP